MGPGTVTLPAAVEPASRTAPVFYDDDFAADRLATCYHDDCFDQRNGDDRDRIVCETIMRAHGKIDEAVALVRGPWTWWEHGRITGYHRSPDGAIEQVLAPVWWFMTRVALTIFPPVPLGGVPGVRIPIRMGRHFVGTASIDVYDLADRSGRIVVRGRFHRVESRVPFVPTSLAARVHLRLESGTCLPPFPRDAGWRGLLREIEAGRLRPAA